RDTLLPGAPFPRSTLFGPNYDVSRDRQRVLGILADADGFQLVVSPNWITELRRRIAESAVGR
ncbi:MAG TPA: hypothetical protein VGS60_19710, partial [Actinomycetes bacterium]|nr:hypothetical protein [Actinomycetes bacterium]